MSCNVEVEQLGDVEVLYNWKNNISNSYDGTEKV